MMAKLKQKSQYANRINDLKDARHEVFGMGQDVEQIWRAADHDYVPHTLSGGKKRTLVQDDTLGWAGSSHFVDLSQGANWQTTNASVNPYIKIQTALSIMIARNPGVELSPSVSKYEKSTLLQKELYKKSWEMAKSLQQLKLFAFNCCKYGWAVGRTYPYQLKNKTKVPVGFDPDNPYFGNEYETKEASEFSGVFREALDPWMVWIDDKTKPYMPLSMRDVVYAQRTPYKTLEKEFKKSPNWKWIQEGNSAEIVAENDKSNKKYITKNMKWVNFYENLDDDVFSVIVDGYPLVEEPLPIADLDGRKQLSVWQTMWTLRHGSSPMGIGINEAIRLDRNLYDKMRNMTVDQIILSIYKMFFYAGTDQLDSDGVIKISPGVGKQVTDPNNVKWLEVPGPGKDAYNGIEMMQSAIDDASGVGKELTGATEEKTAFQSAQNAEFGLRRMQTPLGNITDALEQDAKLTMAINRMIYSIPETVKLTDPDLITEYYEEIKGNPELYGRDEEGNFEAKLFPEVQMNLETSEEGRLIESEDARFFRIMPKGLDWDGTVTVKGQSILVETKVLQKQQTQEVFNIITPLLQWPAELVMKPIKQLLKKYDFDWKDWVPDMWFMQEKQQEPSLFVPAGQQGGQTLQNQSVLPKNEVRAGATQINQTARGLSSPAIGMGR